MSKNVILNSELETFKSNIVLLSNMPSTTNKITTAFLSLYLTACAPLHNNIKTLKIPSNLELSCEVQGEELANFVKKSGNMESVQFQARHIANAYCVADEVAQRLKLFTGYNLVEVGMISGNPIYMINWNK